MDHRYHVYIMANKMNTTLYVGVTNNLERRVFEHKTGVGGYFSKRYKLTKLVHCEGAKKIVEAIEREKELKGWSRKKKERLINALNPLWDDLSQQFINLSSFETPFCHSERSEESHH